MLSKIEPVPMIVWVDVSLSISCASKKTSCNEFWFQTILHKRQRPLREGNNFSPSRGHGSGTVNRFLGSNEKILLKFAVLHRVDYPD